MKRVLIGLGVFALVAGFLWLFRGPIATNRLESRLEDLGYSCDDLEVEVDGAFSFVRIAPFTCRSNERAVERLTLAAPIRIELESLRPRLVLIPSARIELRHDPVTVDADGTPPFADGSRVHGPLVRMLRLFDMERSAHFEQIEIAELEVALAEDGMRIFAEDVRAEPATVEGEQHEQAVRIEVGTLRIPARGGTAITFDDLSCLVEANAATIEGEVGGEAHLGRLELHHEWRFRAHVSGLVEERPRLRFERIDE